MSDRYSRDGFFTNLLENENARSVGDYARAMKKAFAAYLAGETQDDDFVGCACGGNRFYVHLSGRLVCSSCHSEYMHGPSNAPDNAAE